MGGLPWVINNGFICQWGNGRIYTTYTVVVPLSSTRTTMDPACSFSRTNVTITNWTQTGFTIICSGDTFYSYIIACY